MSGMERWIGGVAVVTGASAGIGAAVSLRLADYGLQVVGLARRVDRIQNLVRKVKKNTGRLFPIQADVSKEEDILRAFKWIKDNVGPVSILINNAGASKQTCLIDGDSKAWKQVFDTNLLGLSICTREAIRSMRDNEIAGHVIHINSICGHYVPQMPYVNVYAASKFGVTALTETLRQELNNIDSPIKITSISPGMVATDIIIGNGFILDDLTQQAFDAAPKLKSDDIAEAVLYVLSTPPHVNVQELTIRPVGERL